MRPVLPLAVWVLVAVAPAAAEAVQIDGRVETDTGYDSNVFRDFEGDPAAPVLGDGFVQADGHLDLLARPSSRQRTELLADLGARLFATQSPADTAVGQGTLTHAFGLSPKLVLRLDLDGKDKWAGPAGDWPGDDNRTYADYGGGATLAIGPYWKTRLELRAGYRAFDYFSDTDFSEQGPALSADLIAAPWRRQRFVLGYRLFPQFYRGPQIAPDGTAYGSRFDWYHVASLDYTLTGPVVLTAGYSFVDDASNAYGESFLRHRLELLVGVVLPWEIYAVATGALQLTSYPDGLYLSPQILLLEDDDDLDELSVKLSRDVGKGFSVELRWGYYVNELFQNSLAYRRQVVYLGLAYRH